MTGELNIIEIILQSGIVVKLVLLTLILASFVSWAIIFTKLKLFKNINMLNQKFINYFQKTSFNDLSLRLHNFFPSPLAHITHSCILELEKHKSKMDLTSFRKMYQNHAATLLERVMSKSVQESNLAMESRLATLASVSSVSPFIGLFGTVWGIIDSFQGLAQGGGTIEAVAPGIAEALVATAAGLAAAIPANWFYNHFSSRISEINNVTSGYAQELLNTIDENYLEHGDINGGK
jgi:biopolymer transport protein TolQ